MYLHARPILNRYFHAYMLHGRRDSGIKIYFHGLSLDGEDVKDASKLFRQKMLMDQSKSVDIHVEVEAAQNDSKRLEKLKKLFEDVKKCPYDDIKNGINMERLEKEFNNAMDSIFEANVIATMSAGKSTFINSMIGQKLLPSANTATTAKIVRIINRDGMNDFRCQRYDKNGKPIGDGNELATKDSMKKWNEDSETSFMDVEGDILTFSEADSMTMAFVDTPGPNNSSNEEHYRTTINAISEKKLSMVIYVLNARQLAINDDARLLNKVREAMEKGGRQAQDRFVFVANQFDSFNPDEEDIRKDGLDKAKKYLEDNGIKNPLVIPISAKLALLLRQKQHVGEENLTGTEKREMAFLSGKFLDMPVFNLVNYSKEVLSERNKKRVDELIEEANRAKDDDRKAEILSGVPVVELLLNDFLQKHAFPAKLKDAVDSFRELTALKPKIKAMQEALEGKQEELKKSTEELKAFTNSNERLEKANAYRKEIEGKKYTISEEAERELVKVATDAEETIRTFDDVISLCTSDRPLENEELFEKAGKIKKISMILFNMLMDKRMIENTIPIETAKKIGAEISQFGMEIAVNVHNTLEKRLQTEYHDALDKMRREYEEYVVKAINKAFPSEKVVIKVLIDATMKMPDVDVIIDQRKEDQGWNVSDAEWYKPWTWLDEHWHKYEVVKLSEVIKELIKNLRVYPQKVNAQFKEKAPENLENAKKAILKHIEEIDAKLIETQLKLEKALEDQSQKQKAFDETNNQVKWLNNFDSELEKILEV